MIKANFNAYGSYVTDSLYQWDLNQVLQVIGLRLDVAPEVHFANADMDRAIPRQATLENGVMKVNVPNTILQHPLRIHAYIGIYEGDTFKVVEKVEIPVIPKKRPTDYVFEDTDGEIYSYNNLENQIANIRDLWIETHDQQVKSNVYAWLEEHPEVTTTVQDGELTIDKMVVGTLGYVTPQMFGAKGDGVTDDTDAIQTALNQHTHVVLPNGRYLITSPLVMGLETQRFVGDSLNATIVAANSLTDNMLTMSGESSPAYRSNMELRNITFEGNEFCDGLKLSKNADFFVNNVKITKCVWGVASQDALLYNFHAVSIIDCFNGICFKNADKLAPANNVKFDMCKINAISNYAIYSENGNSTHGVLFLSCEIEATNRNNTIEAPITLQSTSPSGVKPIVTFRNCWLENNPGHESVKIIGSGNSTQYLFDNNCIVNEANTCNYFVTSDNCYLIILNQSDPSTYNQIAVNVTNGHLFIMGSTVGYAIDEIDNAVSIGHDGHANSNLSFRNSYGIKLKSQGGTDTNRVYAQSNRLKLEANVRDVLIDGATGVDLANSYAKPLKLGDWYLWTYNENLYGKRSSAPTAYNDGKILLTIDS